MRRLLIRKLLCLLAANCDYLPPTHSCTTSRCWTRKVVAGVAVLKLEDASGNELWRTETGATLAPGETASRSYTVCGDRVILQKSAPVQPTSCKQLPPMERVDPRPDGCIECLGAYEGMPKRMESRARLASVKEPGERLELTGRVFAADGKPRAGVIVYAFQTNHAGLYPPSVPVRSTFSDSHGRLRAWVRTDNEGRYTFDTDKAGNLSRRL